MNVSLRMTCYLMSRYQSGQTREGNNVLPLFCGSAAGWAGALADAGLPAAALGAAGSAATALGAAGFLAAGLAAVLGAAALGAAALGAAVLLASATGSTAGTAGFSASLACCAALAMRTLAESLSLRFVMIQSPR
jgi:hypothetical protein